MSFLQVFVAKFYSLSAEGVYIALVQQINLKYPGLKSNNKIKKKTIQLGNLLLSTKF